MNYRHKLLNQQAKNQLAQKEQGWNLERQTLQQDILNLQNSTDATLLEQAQKKAQELKKLLDDTVNLLGKEEIKNLGDIRNLLQGQSLKELTTEKDLLKQKVKDQDQALLNLAKQKLTGKKDAEKILNELETNFKEKEKQTKEQHEKEREWWASNLAQEKEAWQAEVKELKRAEEHKQYLIKQDLTQEQTRNLELLSEITKAKKLITSDKTTLEEERNQLAQQVVNWSDKLEQVKEVVGEIKGILNGRLVVFMGKAEVLEKLEKIKKI